MFAQQLISWLAQSSSTRPSSTMSEMYPTTLVGKMKAKYYGKDRDPTEVRTTSLIARFYFLFISISELYLMTLRVLPYMFSETSEELTYYLTIACWFVFIQSMANFACLILYNTSYQVTKDNPDLRKSLWDSHPAANQMTAHNDVRNHNGHVTSSSARHHNSNETVAIDISHTNTNNNATDTQGRLLQWRYCSACDHTAPPRSHHCKLCRVCILKRDHHCYMTGVCIGFWNQRYFVFLNFYVAVASLVGLPVLCTYFSHHYYSQMQLIDYFAPAMLYRIVLARDLDFDALLFVFQFYTLWWTGLVAVGFYVWQMMIISQGLTSHESCHNLPVRCTASRAENFRSVFGTMWLFNFIIPGQILFRQMDDGTTWEQLKVIHDQSSKRTVKQYSLLPR